MGHRFKYEAPRFWKLLLIRFMDSINKTLSPVSYIYDGQTGIRFSINEQEDKLLTILGDRLVLYSALSNPSRNELIDRSFDEVAIIFFNNRQGDVTALQQIQSRTDEEWDVWLSDILAGIKVSE